MSSPSTSFTVEQLGKESSAVVPYGTILESNKLIYSQIIGNFYNVNSFQERSTISEILAGDSANSGIGNLPDKQPDVNTGRQ